MQVIVSHARNIKEAVEKYLHKSGDCFGASTF
jgi:hypothetical protein